MWTADKLMYNGVSYDAAYSGDTLVWRGKNTDYVTFDVTSSGKIIWRRMFNDTPSRDLSYSVNDGVWTPADYTYTEINVASGDKVRFKGVNNSLDETTFSATTATFKVYGNTMSLLYGDNYHNQHTVGDAYTFRYLFYKTKVTDASDLLLPAVSLPSNPYEGMFSDCTLLSKAPALPATSLGFACYSHMFEGCTSLTEAPILPATSLSKDWCYNSMFLGCTSLHTITCLATSITGSNATKNWVDGVSATGTFTKASSMTGWTTGVDGIPSGWTVVDA